MPDKVTMDEQAYLSAVRFRAHRALYWLERCTQGYDMSGGIVQEIRIQAPREGKPGFFAVVKGLNESGERVVAFAGGPSPIEVIDALRVESENKGLRWRPDRPYSG